MSFHFHDLIDHIHRQIEGKGIWDKTKQGGKKYTKKEKESFGSTLGDIEERENEIGNILEEMTSEVKNRIDDEDTKLKEIEEMEYHNKLIKEEAENLQKLDSIKNYIDEYYSLTKEYNKMPEGEEKDEMKLGLRRMRKIKESAEREDTEEINKKDTDYQYRKFFDGSIYGVLKAGGADEKGTEMENLLDKQPEAKEKLFGIGATNSKNIDNPEFTDEFKEYVKQQDPDYLGYFMFDYTGRRSDGKVILGELKTMVDSYDDALNVYYGQEKEDTKNNLLEKLKKAEDRGDDETIEDLKEKLEKNNNMLEYMPLKGSKMFSTGYTKLNYVMGADGKIGYEMKTPNGINMIKEVGMPKTAWILKDGTYEVDLSNPWFYKLKKDKYFLDPEKVRSVRIDKKYGDKIFKSSYTAIPTHYFDDRGKKIKLIKKIKK